MTISKLDLFTVLACLLILVLSFCCGGGGGDAATEAGQGDDDDDDDNDDNNDDNNDNDNNDNNDNNDDTGDDDDDDNDDDNNNDDNDDNNDDNDDDDDDTSCPGGYPSQPACTQTGIANGLEWTYCDTGSNISHYCALLYAENLNLAGKTDWRLPTIAELSNLIDIGNPQLVECKNLQANIVSPFDLSCYQMWSDEINEEENTAHTYSFIGAGTDWWVEREALAFLRALAVRDP